MESEIKMSTNFIKERNAETTLNANYEKSIYESVVKSIPYVNKYKKKKTDEKIKMKTCTVTPDAV